MVPPLPAASRPSKDDNNPLSRLLDPVLHRAQLCLQLPQDLLVLLGLELRPFVHIPGGIKRLVMCINVLLCHLRTTPRGPRSAAYLWRPPRRRRNPPVNSWAASPGKNSSAMTTI